MYSLFIDDERLPTKGLENVIWAKDADEALAVMATHGAPDVISFDHDLGQNNDGSIKENSMFILKTIIEWHLDEKINLNTIKSVIIHTQNSQGRNNLCGLWNGFSAAELQVFVPAIIAPRASIDC